MAYALLLIGILCVQIGASVAKGLFPTIGPVATTSLRITAAAIILTLIWKPWTARRKPKFTWMIVFYGICLGVMNLTFYLSLTRIPLGLCVALEFLGPLTLALFSSRKVIDFVWAGAASLGIFLIVPLKMSSAPLDPVGIGLALTAGVCWALYIVFAKRVGKNLNAGIATCVGMIFAAITVIPFGIAFGQWQNFNSKVLVLAILVGVLSSAIPYSIEMKVLQKMRADTFGILMSLEPAAAALSGFIILGDRLTLSQWIAIFCIMVASAGSAVTSSSH